MKKFFSLIALVMVTTSLMSVSTSAKVAEDDGRASDCARMARATVLALADGYGDDPNGIYFDYYIGMYHTLYNECYNN